MSGNKQLLTEIEAGKFLDLKASGLRRRRREGEAPRYLKIGKNVRYTIADLEEYLDGCIVLPVQKGRHLTKE